jgi:CelD/BcsL family acetyltransferase involved in cellulose biosynthesis
MRRELDGEGFLVDRVPPRTAADMAAAWDDLVDRSPGPSPWLRPGWIGAWWRAFGRGHLGMITLWRGDRLAGVAPFAHARGALVSPTNYHTPAFELVGEDDDAVAELATMLLARRPRLVRARFVAPDGATARALRGAARSHGYRLVERTLARSPYVETAPGWAAYHDELDTKLRRELRRRRRRLEAEGRVEVAVADGRSHLDDLLAESIRVEGLGWKGRRRTAIASDEATDSFYRDVARWAAARGTLRLAFLRLDGRALAVDIAIEDGGRHYLLKTGYDPEARQLAPGLLLRFAMLERAFSSGLRSYEFLGTDEPWKLAWTRSIRERSDLQAFRPGAAGLAGWTTAAYVRPRAVRALARMGR